MKTEDDKLPADETAEAGPTTTSTHNLKASELKVGKSAAKPKPTPETKKPADPPVGGAGGDPEFSALRTVPELVDTYNSMVLTAIDLRIRGVANARTFVDVKTGVLACERLHAQIRRVREEKDGGGKAAKSKKGKVDMAKRSKAKTKAKKSGGARRARLKLEDGAKITWIGVDGGKNPCREGGGRHERVELVRKASGKTYATYLKSGGREGTLSHCVNAGWAKVA